jgi:hypothetical protein
MVVQDPTSHIVTAAISLEKDSSGRGISWSSRIAATSHQNARVFSVLDLMLSQNTILFFVADLKLPGMPEFFCGLEVPGILSFSFRIMASWNARVFLFQF